MNIVHQKDPILKLLYDRTKIEEVLKLINSVPIEACRIILMLRYGERLPWTPGKRTEICVQSRMFEHGLYYSERQMYRLHKQGLEEIRRIFEETKKNEGE